MARTLYDPVPALSALRCFPDEDGRAWYLMPEVVDALHAPSGSTRIVPRAHRREVHRMRGGLIKNYYYIDREGVRIMCLRYARHPLHKCMAALRTAAD